MNVHPPKWADRFLEWYCNPDLLEDLQGDIYELYFERVKHEGKASADRKYVLDVIRFCRWSNIRKSGSGYRPGYFNILWNLNFKIQFRNLLNNKVMFLARMLSLSVSLAFALIVSTFVIQEFSFDSHHIDHDRIYRIGHRIGLGNVVTNYAVSAVALGSGLQEELPEVESAFTAMDAGKPVFTLGDKTFNNESTLIASPDFLKVLTFEFIHGNNTALDDPYSIVLTETTATKFFGDSDPIGQVINLGWVDVKVTAVIKDVLENTHLKIDALISWNTYEVDEGWDNINAYTYIKIGSETDIENVAPKIDSVIQNHRQDFEDGHEHRSGDDITIHAIVENIKDIHLSETLDEDIARKGSTTNIYILIAVIILFLISGLINFLNLSLVELTANIKKISILKVFGGSTADHYKVMITHTLFSIFIVLPVTTLLCYGSVLAAEHYFFIYIEPGIFLKPAFILEVAIVILAFIFSARINSYVISRSNDIVNSLKGKVGAMYNGFQLRGFLVAAQLSFSIIMIALIIIISDQFRFVSTVDKGFEDRNTIVVRMRSGNFSATEAFIESVRKLNGVKNVDGSSFYLDNVETKEFFEVNTASGKKRMLVSYMNCGYEYLDAMKIDILFGRNFSRNHSTDDKGAYIINETAAKEFGWKDPVGKTIWGPLETDRYEGKVIGVVKDFHFSSLHDKIEPLIIFLVNQDWGVRYVYIKLNPIKPTGIIAQVENAYKASYAGLPFEWEYLDAKFLSLYKKDYEIANIFRVGLIISILLSCLGIFSISSLLMITRAREMGIRKIVGANQLQLFSLHLKRFIKLVVISVVIAWPVIYYLSGKWLDSFAYHVDIRVWYFVVPGMITSMIIFITSGYHALKTAWINPVDILKHE